MGVAGCVAVCVRALHAPASTMGSNVLYWCVFGASMWLKALSAVLFSYQNTNVDRQTRRAVPGPVQGLLWV